MYTATESKKQQKATDISNAHICYGKHRLITPVDSMEQVIPYRDGVKCASCSLTSYCDVFRQLDNYWMNGGN